MRRLHAYLHDAFPFTTASGATYDCGDYGRALDLALETAGYKALREEQKQRRKQRMFIWGVLRKPGQENLLTFPLDADRVM